MRKRSTAAAGLLVGLAVAVGAPIGWYATAAPSAEGVGALPAGLTASSTGPAGAPGVAGSGARSWPPVTTAIPVATATIPPVAAALIPARLLIPTAGVDARVDRVGVTPSGAVAIPDDADHLGWYEHGPAPGDPEGSAVIVGHRDSFDQGIGALFDMGSVGVGDPITVIRSDGTRLEYRVVERRLYSKASLPLALLFARTGRPRLTVLTCGGPFDRAGGGYQDNLVVTAVPV